MPDRAIARLIEGQDVLSCAESTSVVEAARQMKRRHVGAMLVVDHGRLIGIFTERDALMRVIAEGRDPQTTTIAEVMTRNPQCISPDKPFVDALRLMYQGRFRHVPVVDHGQPVGMVSARDALGPELENFVSELLADEQAGNVMG